MKPQPCPVLDRSLLRRAERRLNWITGIALGGFVYWLGWQILTAYLAGRFTAIPGGK